MYRRGDPRWNRTIQHIAENIEHANESAQENLWTFTHDYVNPCFGSITQCLNACTAPCFPSRDDRRRHRGRSRGRAELSFDFYDDWEEDENDGLLGWGNDGLERIMGNGGTYGSVNQPARQRGMSFGQRNRDARFNAGRRKSAVQLHDSGADPTIIPSSSYFGFLGRLPFNIGGKGLRYKPSAADLTEHPGHGQGRRIDVEEAQPLIEESEDEVERPAAGEGKGHRRQRSHTNTSGHTTDSLSSRGDIFPSEDELDDAVPLDDEFTMALERRTTNQWNGDDTSSGKTRSGSKSGNRRRGGSRVSSRTASSQNTSSSGKKSTETTPKKRSASMSIAEIPTLSDLKDEEERIRREEEQEVDRKRQEAQQLALKRGLASDQHLHRQLRSPSPSLSITNLPRSSSSPHLSAQKNRTRRSPSPLMRDPNADEEDGMQLDTQTRPDSGSFYVDESDYSSLAPTPNKALSLKDEPREIPNNPGVKDTIAESEEFVPARLPHFSAPPG
ncbi:hypothetical protein P154DRAFT_524367 [Amniculicola lignicola CBS 123094]|uniref:Uncharacterized protein n=1 Tax=Amniculicola lignicola CBS 123094 TaxID=1392246 RepID=A0A6A5WK44_9PLEO|nr:hypothetical protein P154DRAFT_524367 [Amniculicola lignicola CBS 123094]